MDEKQPVILCPRKLCEVASAENSLDVKNIAPEEGDDWKTILSF